MPNPQNKQIFAANLLHYMQEQKKTRSEVCRDLGFKYSTFSEWVTGVKYPRIDKIQMLANYFGVQKSDLIELHVQGTSGELSDTHFVPHLKKIPILGRISAGLPLYAEQQIEGYTFTDLDAGAEYFALRVQGDSMTAARINDGDILIVRRQDLVENGEIAVVLVNNEEATVKQYSHNGNFVILTPKSYNAEHQPQIYDIRNTKIRILGKVVRNQISFE